MSHRPSACIVAAAAVLLAAPRVATARDHAYPAAVAVTVALPPVPPPWVVAALLPPAPAPWVQASPAVYYGWYRGYRAGLDARFAPPPRVARVHGHGYENGHGNGWARGHDRDD